MLRRMVEYGHEVIACAPNADEEIKSALRQLGVKYRHVPIKRAGMNPFADLTTLRQFRKLFAEVRPDLVLAYTIKPVIWGLLAARLARVPARYAMITGLGYAFLDGGGVRQHAIQKVAISLYRAALRGASGVFFQNPDDQAQFNRHGLVSEGTQQFRIHGSGVDLAYFAPRAVPEQPTFLLLARLISDKGIREYREAARRLKQGYPHVRFLLGGPIDSNPSAIGKRELDRWQAEGAVENLGHLSDVRQALADCTVYVLPSYREGTPRTVLEAMAIGRAIITTDAPGCRETVEDGVNGYLVPTKDVEALSKAMEEFIQTPEKSATMGKESLRIARELYDVDKVNTEILKGLDLIA